MDKSLKKMPYDYISFYKKEFIEKTYKKDATTQPMKYATRIYSLIKSFMTLSNYDAKPMLNYQSQANFKGKCLNTKRFH